MRSVRGRSWASLRVVRLRGADRRARALRGHRLSRHLRRRRGYPGAMRPRPEVRRCRRAARGVGCDCDNRVDGICPDPACVDDADCATCAVDCAGRVCGDNGRGGSCGDCSFGTECRDGACQPVACEGSCAGRACGDDGCGRSCGECGAGLTCNTASGACETTCVPTCDERECGTDGCSSSPDACGTCGAGRECAAGRCQCDFFSTIAYTFDAAAVDWTVFDFVSITLTHINIDGSAAPERDVTLDRSSPRGRIQLYGCEPHARIVREYWSRAFGRCDRTDEIRTLDLRCPTHSSPTTALAASHRSKAARSLRPRVPRCNAIVRARIGSNE